MSHRFLHSRYPGRQRGFTLIELSIALLIGLFLIGGLLVMLQSNRRSFISQSQQAQLQDSERLAMTVITDVVQSAGYYPDPVNNTPASKLIAVAPMVAGQAIYGQANVPATLGDKLTVRYATVANDTIINCNGTTNTAGNALYSNEFSVSATNALVCSLNGAAPVELVTGVTNMTVLYGVKRNAGVNNNSVDTYLTVAQMLAADWSNVIALKVSLTFQNPLYIPGQAVPAQFVTFTRVMGVMNQTGVKL